MLGGARTAPAGPAYSGQSREVVILTARYAGCGPRLEGMIVATSAPVAVPEEATRTERAPELPYLLVVWDDPVNLMSYVAFVFRAYFGYDAAKAEELMLQVHREGQAVVASGSRERIEADVVAMHEYGLQATLRRGDA